MAPTVKHLFLGFNVTIFAYGSTGTGKTHTMRGGKSMAERGMIPRLLSSIYRRSRKMEKDSGGDTQVEISMSYYEIYNDRVYDLFEAPEKRTAVGLPLREAGGGKTVVVGLSEMPCSSLKEFELLYDKANANRSTSATKLNAHSSRSHAVLCVKLTITTPTEVRISTASAIDLAGSEDNRRTGNDKERMVESASINKSLFVLAQCVEAISKKQPRIPYRESKMTRILSLGQNNGFTIMILNLAPVKSYHLDTLSSLNFANRTKKIEVREIENEPIFKGPPKPQPTSTGATIQRQPLRPLATGINMNLGANKADAKGGDKPLKAFSVYSDRVNSRISQSAPARSSPLKRGSDNLASTRPTKIAARPTPTSFLRRVPAPELTLSKATIEQLVEQKVSAILAAHNSQHQQQELEASKRLPPSSASISDLKSQANAATSGSISEEVQRRLLLIEQRLEGQEGTRAEGLSFLLMAKQHQARGEVNSALKMYRLARPYFPGNEKLERKIEALMVRVEGGRGKTKGGEEEEGLKVRERLGGYRRSSNEEVALGQSHGDDTAEPYPAVAASAAESASESESDADYNADTDPNPYDDEFDGQKDRLSHPHPRTQKFLPQKKRTRLSSPDPLQAEPITLTVAPTPRTTHLLSIINSRDVSQIKRLKGVGPRRAEGIVEGLAELTEARGKGKGGGKLRSLEELSTLKGVGRRVVEGMREGIGMGIDA